MNVNNDALDDATTAYLIGVHFSVALMTDDPVSQDVLDSLYSKMRELVERPGLEDFVGPLASRIADPNWAHAATVPEDLRSALIVYLATA